MEAVAISPKYQVVIPRKIRESLKLIPGQKVQVIEYGNRIELIQERKISEMRGFLKGINTEIERESDLTEITVYNRAIMLFYTDDELYKQVHKVCCMIDNSGAQA
jgi:AbrB family looped-hinge helix DNA binding protein